MSWGGDEGQHCDDLDRVGKTKLYGQSLQHHEQRKGLIWSIEPRAYPHMDCTRDAIYAFQRRRLHLADNPSDYNWEYDNQLFVHDDAVYDEDKGEFKPLESGGSATLTILKAHELWDGQYTTESWNTEMVFFTREEGEDYGRAKHYNYPDGWRVYCVPAEGRMIKILEAFTHPRKSVEEERNEVYAKYGKPKGS